MHEGKLFWISSGIMHCVRTADGESIFKARLRRPARNASEESDASFAETGTPGGHHSSPVFAGGLMYYVARNGDVYVFRLGDRHELVAVNTFAEGGDFSASPAVSQGELFVRSTKFLYCISNKTNKGP